MFDHNNSIVAGFGPSFKTLGFLADAAFRAADDGKQAVYFTWCSGRGCVQHSILTTIDDLRARVEEIPRSEGYVSAHATFADDDPEDLARPILVRADGHDMLVNLTGEFEIDRDVVPLSPLDQANRRGSQMLSGSTQPHDEIASIITRFYEGNAEHALARACSILKGKFAMIATVVSEEPRVFCYRGGVELHSFSAFDGYALIATSSKAVPHRDYPQFEHRDWRMPMPCGTSLYPVDAETVKRLWSMVYPEDPDLQRDELWPPATDATYYVQEV